MFLKNVDLKHTNFSVKIADFGLSTVLDPRSSVLSIVGTPLYQAPQVLAQVYYDDSIDTWALGTILYELLHGVTPFHCPDEEQLMNKMKDGRYRVRSNGEPVSIEACLFLLECLQIHEGDRIDVDLLLSSPFINEALSGVKLHELDHATFAQELQAENAREEECDSSDESVESPLTRNTEKLVCSENEIDLTIKPSLMREVLVRQLLRTTAPSSQDFQAPEYFMRYRSFLQSSVGDSGSDYGSSEPERRELFVGSVIRSFLAQNYETGEESKAESVCLTAPTKSTEVTASRELQLLSDSELPACETPGVRKEQSESVVLSQNSECKRPSERRSIRDQTKKHLKRKSRAGKLERLAEWVTKQVCCGSSSRPATAGRGSSSRH